MKFVMPHKKILFLILVGLSVVGLLTYFGFSIIKKSGSSLKNNDPPKDNIDVNSPTTETLLNSTYLPILEYAKKNGRLKTQVSSQDDITTLSSETIKNLNELTVALRTTETTYINAEVVTLWFNNFYPDKYTLEERKDIAMENMSDLRTRVASGELTMKQAGDILSNDESLKDVDSAWKSNAYRKITYAKKNARSFLDPEVEKQFWSAQKGELSPLIISHMPDAPGNPEGSILFFKINEREDKEYDSYEEVMDTYK